MVAKLITTSTDGEKKEYLLTSETVTIGRKPSNDIPIDNLSVSGRHAQVITILEDSFLEDLGSTNGTYVNGKLVKKHALEDGDSITLGKYQITYHNPTGGSPDRASKRPWLYAPEKKVCPRRPGVKKLTSRCKKYLPKSRLKQQARQYHRWPIRRPACNCSAGPMQGKN